MFEIFMKYTRDVIALLVVATFCYLAIMGEVDPKEFVAIVGVIAAFFYGNKAALDTQAAQVVQAIQTQEGVK